jgi:hypothetical protein
MWKDHLAAFPGRHYYPSSKTIPRHPRGCDTRQSCSDQISDAEYWALRVIRGDIVQGIFENLGRTRWMNVVRNRMQTTQVKNAIIARSGATRHPCLQEHGRPPGVSSADQATNAQLVLGAVPPSRFVFCSLFLIFPTSADTPQIRTRNCPWCQTAPASPLCDVAHS